MIQRCDCGTVFHDSVWTAHLIAVHQLDARQADYALRIQESIEAALSKPLPWHVRLGRAIFDAIFRPDMTPCAQCGHPKSDHGEYAGGSIHCYALPRTATGGRGCQCVQLPARVGLTWRQREAIRRANAEAAESSGEIRGGRP